MAAQGTRDVISRLGPAPDFDALVPLHDHVITEDGRDFQLCMCGVAPDNQGDNGQGDMFQHVGFAEVARIGGFVKTANSKWWWPHILIYFVLVGFAGFTLLYQSWCDFSSCLTISGLSFA